MSSKFLSESNDYMVAELLLSVKSIAVIAPVQTGYL
jgi:hypothetical protein